MNLQRLPLVLLAAYTLLAADPVADVLARMDRAASAFRSLSADVHNVTHTDVINTDEKESGSTLVKRVKANDLRMLTELREPDPKTVVFQGGKAEMYLPKAQVVQVYDAGKYKGLLEKFFLLGFGVPAADLQKDYAIRAIGEETIDSQNAAHLELIPKSPETLKHLKKVELWILDSGYPVRQKFHQSGGDYRMVTYSNTKINPDISDNDLKLKVPKGVKQEYPGK